MSVSRPSRRRVVACGVLAVAATVAALTGVATPTATASQGTHHDTLVSADPAESTPHLLDGTVTAIAEVGDRIIVGGTFTRATDADGQPEYARGRLLAFDPDTGAIDPDFAPQFDAKVTAVAAGPEDSIYVAGAFTQLNGQPIARVVRLNARTGFPVREFAPPHPDREVRDLDFIAGRLFIAGEFKKLGQVEHPALAELDPGTGALLPTVDVSFAPGLYGGPVLVHKMDVTPDGTELVMVGNFSAVDDLPRPQIAVLNLRREVATVANWSTDRFRERCARRFYFFTRDVELSPDGTYFVVVTTGAPGDVTRMCDTASRWELTVRGHDLQPTWVDHTGGDSLYATVITDTAVYVGGHQRWSNNPFGSDTPGPGAVSREGVAALDPVNGLPLSWNPGRTRGVGVQELYATPDGLYMGSDTAKVNGEYHARLAFFPVDPTAIVPQPPDAELPVEVYFFGSQPGHRSLSAEHSIRHRTFDGSVGPASSYDSGVSWRSARASTLVDDTLYSAWSGGHLYRRTFTDGSLGETTEVDLRGLTRFGTALDHLSGLFYSHGRLYYTRSDRAALYSRAFTVENDLVGAQQTTVRTQDEPVPWSRVDGMFLASGRLYWVHRTTGVLRSVRWADGAPVAGTTRKISGPRIDGVDWRARSLSAAD
jgi:hypothetical protein